MGSSYNWSYASNLGKCYRIEQNQYKIGYAGTLSNIEPWRTS